MRQGTVMDLLVRLVEWVFHEVIKRPVTMLVVTLCVLEARMMVGCHYDCLDNSGCVQKGGKGGCDEKFAAIRGVEVSLIVNNNLPR